MTVQQEKSQKNSLKGRAIKKSLSIPALLTLILLFMSCFSKPLFPADWTTLAQPIGTPNDPFLIYPVNINTRYAPGQGPWDEGTMITSITTTTPQFFVRFYNPTAPLNPSNQEGSWIMRASEVRGLTAEQIRDTFALPNLPTMMTLGVTSAGETLYTGVAAPIAGWGEGGGQQSQQKAGPYTSFFNGQPIVVPILDYTILAETPNGRAIATYLMAHAPEPYSDMESVYNSMDVLWNPDSKALFNSALASISPERFDNLFFPWFNATMLHNRTIGDRSGLLRTGKPGTEIWAQTFNAHETHPEAGFENEYFGLAAGIDKSVTEQHVYGCSLAWIRATLEWSDGGVASADYYRGAVYASLLKGSTFLQVILSAGIARQNIARTIGIETIYHPSPHGPAASMLSPVWRNAGSTSTGWDTDFTFRAGVTSATGPIQVQPMAEAGILHQTRNKFRENGAGSLDLLVSAAQATTFHSGIALRVDRSRRYELKRHSSPYVALGWKYHQRLDNRTVSAALNGLTDTFSVNAPDTAEIFLTKALGVAVALDPNASLFTEVYHEVSGSNANQGIRAGISW